MENLLRAATLQITEKYIQLPIAGLEDPIYRERVYCYELYHQLRSVWPQNSIYELSGEVDKAGHPLIRENHLDGSKPDLLVHTPGNMEGNYCVIEVKPINTRRGIIKDLQTLTAFRTYAGYQKAIYLFYGNQPFDRVIRRIVKINDQFENDIIDINLIDFWFHTVAGEEAVCVDFRN